LAVHSSVPAPLAGLRVIALEHFVTAPIATRHLADLGADVIKIERPGSGDPQRQNEPLVKGISANFLWNNRNKRSLALDLKEPRARDILQRLLTTADVFIHNLGPGAIRRMGLDHAAVSALNERLITCEISGFGDGGPYDNRKAMDAVVQGEAGLMSLTGTPEVPCRVPVPMGDIAGGLSAVIAILAALAGREKSGKGAEIRISMFEAIADWCVPQLTTRHHGEEQAPRSGGRNPVTVPHGVYRCAGGEPLNILPLGNWQGFCAGVLRRPELADDLRFRSNSLRVQNRAVLETLIEDVLADVPKGEVIARLEAIGAAYGDVNDMAGVLEHPQLAARGRWFDMPTPAGPIRSLHHPFNIAGAERPNRPVPAVGEHSAEILREIGLGD
jgi:crotonobetainyl-CoA:carnitine CoA-transferase CaiB-like acyl-CoA transferase